MLKNFKLVISGILVAASSFGAVAQTETYKAVVLDGKPAKLNVRTGEVVLVTSSTDSASVIKPSVIKNAPNNKAKSELTKPTVITDIISKSLENQKITLSSTKPEDEVAIAREKAKSLVYDVSKPVLYAAAAAASDFHKVKKGETLYVLSKRYGTSLGELKKANNLETTLIVVGQNLRIRNFDSSFSGQNSLVWTVSKGDTLYNIAKRNNTTVASIKSLNSLVNNLIKIGQKLQLN